MNISDIHLLIEGIQINTNFNRFNKNSLIEYLNAILEKNRKRKKK